MANRIVRRSFAGRGVVQRRKTLWLASTAETAVTNLGANLIIFDQSLTTAEKARRPFTIVRTRGRLWVRSDQTAATETPLGALGMAVVSDQATAIGGTALPLPITNQDSELWFVWEPFASMLVQESAIGFSPDVKAHATYLVKVQQIF